VSDRRSIMLVDDEAPARERLERLLKELPDWRLCGSFGDPQALISACRKGSPEVVLLDVEMPGCGGIELARQLSQLAKPPAIVFVTAYEQYALDAFGVEALDYLVKPVGRQRLAQALERVVRFKPDSDDGRGAPALVSRVGDRTMRIPIEQIRILHADEKYTSVHYLGGEVLIEDSLVRLEQRYPGVFVRVHRNALVARRAMRALFRDGEGRDRVEVEGSDRCPEVSRRCLAAVRRVLKHG